MCSIQTSKFGKSASCLQHRDLSLTNSERKVSWQLCTLSWNSLFSHPLHTHLGHSNPPLTWDTLLFVCHSISSGLSRAYYSFNRQGSVGFVWNGSNSRLVKIFILWVELTMWCPSLLNAGHVRGNIHFCTSTARYRAFSHPHSHPFPSCCTEKWLSTKSKTWLWNNSEALHWVLVSAAAASAQDIATINMC